jgi:hypothetical protein
VTGTVSGNAFSPSTGVTGNFLTPGIYMICLTGYLYNGASTVSTTNLTFGVVSSTFTNPNSGNTTINSISLGGYTIIGSSINSLTFNPTLIFYAATSLYYYGFVSSAVVSTNGTLNVGVTTTAIVRIG